MNILELNPIRIGMEIPRINICPYCGGRERTVAGIPPLSFSARMRAKLVRLTQYGKCVQKPVDYLASVTQTGKCEQSGTPTPSSPVDIKCNNGTIKVSVNLANMVSENIVVGKYINNSGAEATDSANFYYSAFIPVTPGGTYTMKVSRRLAYFSVMEYDSSKGFLSRDLFGSSSTPAGDTITFTLSNDCAFIRFGSNMQKATITEADVLAEDWMLTEGATGQDYRPYKQVYIEGTPEVITDANGNTASAVNLLGVVDYADTQEFLSGAVGRQIGVYVFDGTEAFEELTDAAIIRNATAAWGTVARAVGLCTHLVSLPESDTPSAGKYRFATALNFYQYKTTFGVSTIPELKALLARLFAAGNPVIMLFPLATPTTESVPAQMLVKGPITVTAEVSNPTITTTEAPVSTPDPVHPLPVWCNNGVLKWNGTAVVADGTPEVLTLGGQNLVDLTAVTDDYYYDQNGVYTALSNARLTDYIPVRAGQKYTVYAKAQRAGVAANVRCNLFNSAKVWKSQSSFTVTSGSENVGVVTPSEDGYLRVSANYTGTGAKVDWSVLQIVRGEYTLATMPPYEPYTAQTASVENLLGVGDDKDEQNIISGLLTHKIGIMVFDGTEAWRASSSGENIYILTSAIGVNLTAICTHFLKVPNSTSSANMPDGSFKGHTSNAVLYFKYEAVGSLANFKDWLAAEYANGTPVIVIYPLATPTTEQVQGQALYANKGENTLSIQANVDGIEVSLTYKD